MRKFILKGLLGIIATLVLAMAIICFRANHTYWPYRIPVIKSKIILRDSATIVLGSSHAYYGINSRLVSGNCFNYAATSQNFYEDYGILKALSKTHTIKSIILPFSYFSNSAYMERATIDGERVRIFDYMCAHHLRYSRDPAFVKSSFILLTQLARSLLKREYQESKIDNFGNVLLKCDSTNHILTDTTSAVNRHSQNANFTSLHPYFDSIVTLCNAKGIHMNVIVFPFTSAYNRQMAVRNPGFEVLLARIKNIPNIQFADYRDFIKSNEPLYFKDADHLSPCGRDMFSAYLATKIK